MTETAILKEMIQEKALVDVTVAGEFGNVRLQEPQEVNCFVTIKDMPDDALVIKADCFSSPGSFFKGKNGECKRADYIIVSEKKKCIIYIEMKNGKKEWHHIVKQLKGAYCLMEYCKKIAISFWDRPKFLENYKERFIAIDHLRSSDKRPTRNNTKTLSPNTPEKAMKLSERSIYYRRIAWL